MSTDDPKSSETEKAEFGMSDPFGLSLMKDVFPVSPLILL